MGEDLSLLTAAEGSIFVKLRRLLERIAIDLHTRRLLVQINQLHRQRDQMPAKPENPAIANHGIPDLRSFVASIRRQLIGEQFLDLAAFFPVLIDNLSPTGVMLVVRAEA